MVEMFGVLVLQKRGNLLHQHVAHAKIDSVLDKAVHELVSGVIRVSAPHSADALARRPSDHGVWRAAEGDRVDVLSGRQSFSDGFRLVLHQRSEEHTSELQSLMRISYAVFCLKKKNCTIYTTITPTIIDHMN